MTASDPRTQFRETIAPDEDVRFERVARELGEVAVAGDRALHPKAHAGAEARLVIRDDVPAELRVGIFAEAGKAYRALARFSNGSRARESDAKPDLRGLAIKVFDVPGAKLIPGLEGATTQDFLLIHSPTVPFRTPEEFVFFVRAARSPALLVPRLVLEFGPVRAVGLLAALVKMTGGKVGSLANLTFYTVAPLRFGSFAAKLRFTPRDARHSAPSGAADALRGELLTRLASGTVAWDVGAQLFVDEARTPIEDSTRPWDEAASPVIPLARLELPRQAITSERGKRLEAYVESLSFDPWHAPVEFRPLGATMRARNPAYRVSTKQRGAAGEPAQADVPWTD
jgi:hypothetical protein